MFKLNIFWASGLKCKVRKKKEMQSKGSRGDRDLGIAFQTHPGRQAFVSSGSKEPRSALESRRVRGLLMVALRSQGNWRWEGPLGTPLGLVHWKRASSPVEAGTAGYL